MPSCPHCRAESTTARSCYGDQICVVCLNQCTQFGVLECGHLICIDCTRTMGFDVIGAAVKQSWEFERSRDGITGKVTHIRNPTTGRLVSIKGPSGREALALEQQKKQEFLAKERKKFLQENRPRSSSPPAARTIHQPTRSLSPIRDEAQMIEPDTVIFFEGFNDFRNEHLLGYQYPGVSSLSKHYENLFDTKEISSADRFKQWLKNRFYRLNFVRLYKQLTNQEININQRYCPILIII